MSGFVGLGIQPLDLGRTLAQAESIRGSRLAQLAQQREIEQADALGAFLADPRNAEGLASNDPGVMRGLAQTGIRGLSLALPRMDQARENAEFQALVGSGPVAAPAGARPASAGQYRDLIAKVAAETGVPPLLLASVMNRESGGNPAAAGDTTLPGGPSIGLMQIRPDTARSPGFGVAGVDPATLADPEANLRFGAQYLRALRDANGGNWTAALQAYNGGQGNVQRGTVSPAAQGYAEAVGRSGGVGGASSPSGGPSNEQLAALAAHPNARVRQWATAMLTLRQREAPREQPLSPEVEAQRIRIAQASRDQQNINVGGERAWDQESAKLFAKRYDDITSGAMNAQQMLGMYNLAEQALGSGVRTGFGAETEMTLRQFGAALGLDTDPGKLAGGELIRSVQNRMALLMRSPDGGMGMPGALSDRDIQFLKAAQIGIDRSPEGNQRLLSAFRAMEQRKIEIARLADEYIAQNGRLDAGFNRAVREFAAANPLFAGSAQPQAAPSAPAQGLQMEPQERPGQPVRVRTPEEARQLPSGTPIILPDGRLGTVP